MHIPSPAVFARVLILFVVALLPQIVKAALTPNQVVINIKAITTVSQDANTALASLSPHTTPTDIAISGQVRINLSRS